MGPRALEAGVCSASCLPSPVLLLLGAGGPPPLQEKSEEAARLRKSTGGRKNPRGKLDQWLTLALWTVWASVSPFVE